MPRGAGTGLSGGANAVSGCVILDLSQMNQVLEIDPDNLLAVVQPGAVNNDVKAAVAEHGLWYPPDPGYGRAPERSVALAESLGRKDSTLTGWSRYSRRRSEQGSAALLRRCERDLAARGVRRPAPGVRRPAPGVRPVA